MSLYKEKQSEESLILMYEATCSELFSLVEGLEKVIQLGWFGTPTNYSLFTSWTWYRANYEPRWFLDEDNIKIWLSLKNGVDNWIVFLNVLWKNF